MNTKVTVIEITITIANNFNSSIDNDKECVMHSKSDNIEFMIIDDADKVIKKIFWFTKE